MKICFVGLDNYSVLHPEGSRETVGGESVQQTFLAKAFRERGHEVSMVVKDSGQVSGQLVDGIRLFVAYNEREGIPIARFLHPRLTGIWTALKSADADVYYQSCAGMLTGVTAAFCRRSHRKFVFRVASDSDCIPGKQLIRFWRDRKIYEYGLRKADLVSTQSEKQSDLLAEYYSVEGVVTNMVLEVPREPGPVSKAIDILWVNNLRGLKRPELVIELAKRMPEYRFTIIGGPMPGYEKLYEFVSRESDSLQNCDFLGPIPYGMVNDYFQNARIFLNTSDIEGFPNSFLQAWVRGLPVVSFFDPDRIIATRQFGAVPANIDDMEKSLRGLLDDSSELAKIGEAAREFALLNYSPERVAEELERQIDL